MPRTKPSLHAISSGMLLAGAAVPFVLADAPSSFAALTSPLQLTAVLASCLLLVSGLLVSNWPALGRVGATLGTFSGLAVGLEHLAAQPLLTLVVLVVCAGALTLLWDVGSPLAGAAPSRTSLLYEGQAWGAAVVALVLWLSSVLFEFEPSLSNMCSVAYALGLAGILNLEWAWRQRRQHRPRAVALGMLALLASSSAGAFWREGWWSLFGLAALAACALVVLRRSSYGGMERIAWWEPLLGHPERLLVGTFLTLCIAGTLLLALPHSSSTGHSIDILDAAFTATSAVCVTGLVVLDTPQAFSPMGQALILLLIQVGGLGIMTFSTATLWALGRRMSLRHETAVASLVSPQDRGMLYATARRILALTCVSETIGAVLLTLAFLGHGDSWGTAVWRGVFTAISAFCNAGFALQSASLIPYQTDPLVLHSVALLIILGGLSPLAVFSVPALIRRDRPVSAQAKLSLAAAAILLPVGFMFILALEWSSSLAGMTWFDRIHNAWFQSVTLRTAGFNSVDFMRVQPVTLTLMMFWMFIGGSPGGTAGGVKTTTIMVLVLSVVQAIRGQWSLVAYGKRISERTRAKAAVVVALAMASGILALVVIQLTQRMPTEVAVFEVVSALGTVGLSTGGTAALDGIGKVVIMLCMFVGRVGGLSLLMFLSSQTSKQVLGHPEEEVGVG